MNSSYVGMNYQLYYEVKNTQLFQAPLVIVADPPCFGPLNKRRWYPATLMLMRV